MTTVQVEDDVKRELFSVAAELQARLGRKVSLNEAIRILVESYRSKDRDVKEILSFFGSLSRGQEARELLKEMRHEEDFRLERIAGKRNL
jgi:predicted CopG family antitoxin